MKHRNSPHQVNAVVLSFSGHAEAYDIVRSLGMDGVVSIVATCQSHDIAFYSRFCTKRILLPNFETSSERFIVDQLKLLSTALGLKPILFYVSDTELSFVWRFQEELRSYYRFLLPRDEIFEHLFNKALFCKFAHEHDLPVPQTIIINNIDELDSIVASIRLPCIVKPAYREDWTWKTEELQAEFGPYKRALRRFTSARELIKFCNALPHRDSGLLIQSYIEGRDEAIISFHGYFDDQSRCLGYFLGRKIRTYPSHTGVSVYVQTIRNKELAQESIGYLERIRFQGIVKIDYKLDQTDHEFKMLEINPRYNLWVLLGAYAGVNLAAIAYRHQMGETVEPSGDYDDDARLLFFKQDLRAYFFEYRKTKEWTFISYVNSLIKKKYYRVFDPRDPLPFIVSAIGFAARNAFRLFRWMVNRLHRLSSRLRLRASSIEK